MELLTMARPSMGGFAAEAAQSIAEACSEIALRASPCGKLLESVEVVAASPLANRREPAQSVSAMGDIVARAAQGRAQRLTRLFGNAPAKPDAFSEVPEGIVQTRVAEVANLAVNARVCAATESQCDTSTEGIEAPPAVARSNGSEIAMPPSGEVRSDAAPISEQPLIESSDAQATGKAKSKGKSSGKGAPVTKGVTEHAGKAKGKGKGAEPAKPRIEPGRDMKSLPWTRFQNDDNTKDTIWDSVHLISERLGLDKLVPTDEMEQRFAKSAKQVGKAEPVGIKKSQLAKLESISKEERFQKEVGLRTLPGHLAVAADAVSAICELNDSVVTLEALQTLHRFLCPNEQQQRELQTARQEGTLKYNRALAACEEAGLPPDSEPVSFRWEPLESYMEVLGQFPACEARLSAWGFIRGVTDRIDTLKLNVDQFDAMVKCFLNSEKLPSLLGIVLAFGNYLNGGKNEKRLGRADGFHIEALGRPGGLDVVNDPQGGNIRQLIFRVFFGRFPEEAHRLLEELAPLFLLVHRRLGKSADGALAVQKKVHVQIEDLHRQVTQLKVEFNAQHQMLKDAVRQIGDDTDKFSREIPARFQTESQRLEELVAKTDDVSRQFKEILIHFRAETYRGDSRVVNGTLQEGNPREEMTSEVWCRLWDDFFIVPGLMLCRNERLQKHYFEPLFCRDVPPTAEGLEVLWMLRDPPKQLFPKAPARTIAAAKKSPSPKERRSQPKQLGTTRRRTTPL
jgi:hypothetical protein